MAGKTIHFSESALKEEIMREGRVLRLHPGAVEIIAGAVAKDTAKWVEKRSIITKNDLNTKVGKELEKYNRDLAYIYQNRGKIV